MMASLIRRHPCTFSYLMTISIILVVLFLVRT